MRELAGQVLVGIVGGAGPPHFPDDLQPALAEAAQGLGVGLAPLAQRRVIDRRPGGLGAALVGEEVDGMPQVLVTGAPDAHLVDLAGLVADRRGAGHALQALGVVVQGAVAADLAEQPRRELGAGSGQRAEQTAVGVAGEEGLDTLAVGVELAPEDAQLLATGDGEEALGGDDGCADMPFPGFFKCRDPFLIGRGPVKFVAVEEFLPLAFAAFGEGFRGGECFDEGPGARADPVVKGSDILTWRES